MALARGGLFKHIESGVCKDSTGPKMVEGLLAALLALVLVSHCACDITRSDCRLELPQNYSKTVPPPGNPLDLKIKITVDKIEEIDGIEGFFVVYQT